MYMFSSIKNNSKKKPLISFKVIIIALICFVIIAFLFNPAKYIKSFSNGLIVWATMVVPAVFPFFFFSIILIELGMAQKISVMFSKITSKVFKTSGISSYIFFMSVISGYPVGSKLIADFYNKGLIDSKESARISTFCSSASPMFILGSIGIGLLGSYKAGLILFISQLLSSVLNGIIFRNYQSKDFVKKPAILPLKQSVDNILSESIYNSVMSVLIVGGFISIFYMMTDIFFDAYFLYPIKKLFEYVFKLVGIDISYSNGIARGIIEVTNGCINICQNKSDIILNTTICGFLVSWGGLSIHMQNLTFLVNAGVKIRFYFLSKTVQAFIMLIITIALCLIFY